MDRELNHKLKKLMCKTLEGYADIQNIGGKALEDITNMIRNVKNLGIIESQGEGGASMRGMSGDGYYMGSYDDGGASMRRGRDSMGRYVSRDDGASMHRGQPDEMESLKKQLRSMMEELDKMR